MGALKILLVDNYDSYTYNLYHLLAGANDDVAPCVVRADAYPSLKHLQHALGAFDAHVVSPGPGSPHNHDDLSRLVRDVITDETTPMLGVCLGMQALCAERGARVTTAPCGPVHGRLSRISRANDARTCPLMQALPDVFDVVRYHSLAVDSRTLPPELVVTAWAYDGPHWVPVPMAVRHINRDLYGVQFHPESIETRYGDVLARRFVDIARRSMTQRRVPTHVQGALSVQAPDRSRARGEPMERLTVLHKELYEPNVDSAALFSALYGNAPEAFWLDSSDAASSPRLSPCSSPESTTGSASTSPPAHASPSARGRFSIMGDASGPRAELVVHSFQQQMTSVRHGFGAGAKTSHIRNQSIHEYLQQNLSQRQLQPARGVDVFPFQFRGGYVGYFGYELKAEVDGISCNAHKSALPDAWFVFADRVVIFDHSLSSVHLVAVVSERNGATTSRCHERDDAFAWFERTEQAIAQCREKPSDPVVTVDTRAHSNRDHASASLRFWLERSKDEYIDDIRTCLDLISAGETYEVCLTNRIRCSLASANVSELELYKVLRVVNPAPYSAYLRIDPDTAVLCSSPERFLHFRESGEVESKPIKGTRPRGRTPAQDADIVAELSFCKKDRSENLMIVDLVRNDLGRTCKIGSVTVPKLMDVETYASVHQLVSTIRAQLRPDVTAVDCMREAYPMGSMTGAPKVRTMRIIDGVERSARGVYSGSIGFFSLCGAADLNVVIRTAVVRHRIVEIGVGGAIVALSDPHEEFEEIIVKGRALMKALSLAATGSATYVLDDSGAMADQAGREGKARDANATGDVLLRVSETL